MIPVWLVIFVLVSTVLPLFVILFRYRRAITSLREESGLLAANMEAKIEKARVAVRARSDFLSKMSHEIRTPLNAILGMLQIAQNTSNTHKANDCMQKMESSSKHLLGVINDILDFSKIESGNFTLENQWFSLSKEIDFIVSMLRGKIDEKQLTLAVKCKDIQHDGIQTDKLRLNQVLINLLANAVKFTDSGGNITLEIEELFHHDGQSVYRFTVRDTGVGIEPEQAKKLFTPFTQANTGVSRVYGGTGLGLAISQSLVRMMGGDIELDTKPGAGSAFQFTIQVPAREKMEKNLAALPLPLLTKFKGRRILVVDDIEINREIVVELLRDSGIITEICTNGQQALEMFCQNEPYRYDLILMDMQMPVLDGCAATREIRDCQKADALAVKIIAMTANVMQEDVERAKQAGMNGYLTKPLDLRELYAVMRDNL